jgi:hypothetical protein
LKKKKTSNTSLYEDILRRAEFFHQRPNFLVDMAEKVLPGVGNTGILKKKEVLWRK